jgi:choline transport protein
MENTKSNVVAHRDSESQEGVLEGVSKTVSEKRGTDGDQRDMYRMGKQQELRRNFRFVSIFGYSMVLMATWETILTYVVVLLVIIANVCSTLIIPLTNGGTVSIP